jgi:hypothetical protein
VQVGYCDCEIFTVVTGIEKTSRGYWISVMSTIIEKGDAHFIITVGICEGI